MSQINVSENLPESTSQDAVLAESVSEHTSSGLRFNIVKINNYFKLYKTNYSESQLKKLHDLVYSGTQFEVEYRAVIDVQYNILNQNIIDEHNFIKREFTDETLEDVTKYIKMLGESMAFLRDSESESLVGTDGLFHVKDGSLYESLRIGSGTRKISDMKPEDFLTRPDIKSIEKEYSRLDKELVDKIWANMEVKKDKEPISVRGMDYDLSNLCPYSTDYGSKEFSEQVQSVTIHENINRSELTASHKVLYNRHFFNAILVDKFTYDMLFSSDQVKKLLPEIEVICELYLKDESEINEFSDLIMHEIFYSSEDLRKIVNFYLSKNNNECPSITAIRKYINTNFTLDSDIANRIQFKVLFDDICSGMNINSKYHEAIKRSLPLLLTELGLAKKRYSEGIFWYGLKKLSGLLGPIDLNKNIDQLTSEIVKLRDAQDTETSKVLSYVFDDKIPKTPISTKPNKPKNANHQLRSVPIIPDVPQGIERPWFQSTIEANPYPSPVKI